MNLLERYDALDAALVRAGWHPTTQWWLDQLDRFLGASCLRWVVRAGRRAGKSSTMCRLAVCVALSDHWRPSISPGDRGVIAFVSVDRKEASNRLYTIASILRALGVPFDERGEEIELRDRPVVFRVVTSSISGTVGFTSIAVFADELARWESGTDAANPAAEVLSSLRPTLAGVEGAIEVCVSSPWGLTDEHARLFDLGDDDDQVVSAAATWIARPQFTEAYTHTLERDPIKWSREYGAIPGSLESSAFDSTDIAAAFRDGSPAIGAERILCFDPSRMKHDDFAWAIVSCDDDGVPVVIEVGGLSPPATTDQALEGLVEVARRHNVTRAFSDDYQGDGNQRYLAQHGITLNFYAWSQSSKSEAGALLRRLISERQIAITVEHGQLRSQLLTQRAKLSPSTQRVVYETNGRDYIACLFAFCDAVVRGEFSIEMRRRGTWTEAQLDAMAELPPIADPSDASALEKVAEYVHAQAYAALEERSQAMFDEVRARRLPRVDDGVIEIDFTKLGPAAGLAALKGFAAANSTRRK